MISLLLIKNNNKHLLFKRTDNGLYGLPGGHVNENETPLDGLIREIQEELGILIPNVVHLGVFPYRDDMITLYYHNNPDFDVSKIKLNDEHSEFKWFTYFDIINTKNIMDTVPDFINCYFDK